MAVHFLVAALRREPTASGARVADTDSHSVAVAVAAYGLPQGWRDFLPCSEVFCGESKGGNERAKWNVTKWSEGMTALAWVR